MKTETLLHAKITQLELLQTRIGLHGSRMWQLPLTYLGSIAISLTATANQNVPISLSLLFTLLAALGLIMLWCLRGAQEGYQRTAKNMNALESELGLQQYTKCYKSHMYPYYALMLFGVLFCIWAAIKL